jgi:hypothetical protein
MTSVNLPVLLPTTSLIHWLIYCLCNQCLLSIFCVPGMCAACPTNLPPFLYWFESCHSWRPRNICTSYIVLEAPRLLRYSCISLLIPLSSPNSSFALIFPLGSGNSSSFWMLIGQWDYSLIKGWDCIFVFPPGTAAQSRCPKCGWASDRSSEAYCPISPTLSHLSLIFSKHTPA